MYCEYWHHKLENNPAVVFPKKLIPPMAHITPGFSFAFLQECFVATLLILARGEVDAYAVPVRGDDGLDKYELWRVFKQQADILRKEVEGQEGQSMHLGGSFEDAAWGTPQDRLPVNSAVGELGENQHQHAVEWSGRQHAALPDLERLRIKDEILPALKYPYVKRGYINTTAFEYRL